MYPIETIKALLFAFPALYFNNNTIWSQLEYNRGRAYVDSGHVRVINTAISRAYADSGHVRVHVINTAISHTHILGTAVYEHCTHWVRLHSHLHCTNSSRSGSNKAPF